MACNVRTERALSRAKESTCPFELAADDGGMNTFYCLVPVAIAFTLCCTAAEPLTGHAPIEIPNSRGGFDYLQVDDGNRRLLLDHTGNGTLDVIDLKAEKVLKQIKTGAAQGVAIDSERGLYLVAVSKEKKLVVIDSKTLEKKGEVPLNGP